MTNNAGDSMIIQASRTATPNPHPLRTWRPYGALPKKLTMMNMSAVMAKNAPSATGYHAASKPPAAFSIATPHLRQNPRTKPRNREPNPHNRTTPQSLTTPHNAQTLIPRDSDLRRYSGCLFRRRAVIILLRHDIAMAACSQPSPPQNRPSLLSVHIWSPGIYVIRTWCGFRVMGFGTESGIHVPEFECGVDCRWWEASESKIHVTVLAVSWPLRGGKGIIKWSLL